MLVRCAGHGPLRSRGAAGHNAGVGSSPFVDGLFLRSPSVTHGSSIIYQFEAREALSSLASPRKSVVLTRDVEGPGYLVNFGVVVLKSVAMSEGDNNRAGI